MFDIKIIGLEKAKSDLDRLARKAQALAGEHKIPVPKGMTKKEAVEEWLRKNLPV